MHPDHSYRRGNIYIANLGYHTGGSVQTGIRPVVVVQNNAGNFFGPTLTVVPLTSRTTKKPHQPTHALLEHTNCLKALSIAMTEQIVTIDKWQVDRYLGSVAPEDMHRLDEALLVALGCHIPDIIEFP